MNAVLYLAQNASGKYVKVGITSNFFQRKRQYLSHGISDIMIVCDGISLEDAKWMEKRCHAFMHEEFIHKFLDWFAVPDDYLLGSSKWANDVIDAVQTMIYSDYEFVEYPEFLRCGKCGLNPYILVGMVFEDDPVCPRCGAENYVGYGVDCV